MYLVSRKCVQELCLRSFVLVQNFNIQYNEKMNLKRFVIRSKGVYPYGVKYIGKWTITSQPGRKTSDIKTSYIKV